MYFGWKRPAPKSTHIPLGCCCYNDDCSRSIVAWISAMKIRPDPVKEDPSNIPRQVIDKVNTYKSSRSHFNGKSEV